MADIKTRILLMQLTSAMSYPDLATAGASHYTVEPTPCATARQVWCHQFDPDDKTPSGEPLRSYGGTGNSKDEIIYHPASHRDSNGYAIGHPAFRCGDRVFCFWNRQSGRWEIISPPQDIWRFELKTALTPCSHATAYLLEDHSGCLEENIHVEFDVYDAFDGTLRGQAKTETAPGTQGYAKFMPDSGRWEIIYLQHQARWIRFMLVSAMSHYDNMATAEVEEFWDGYNPDPNDNYIYVINCVGTGGQYLFAGSSGMMGMACHDPLAGNYRIVQMGSS
jgi:hypothetical protein